MVLRLVRVFQAIFRRERHDGVGQLLPFPRDPNALYEMDVVEYNRKKLGLSSSFNHPRST